MIYGVIALQVSSRYCEEGMSVELSMMVWLVNQSFIIEPFRCRLCDFFTFYTAL